MKKIISLCLLILSLAIVVTAFTACGDKTEEETTTTTEAAIQLAPGEENGFSADVEDTQVIVKKDGKEFQILKYPTNPNFTFDKAYAENHYEFLDMNFDGLADLYIAASSSDGVINYYCWLYNGTTNKFDYSIILSALKNISVDAENHRILSTVNNGGESVVVSYHWVDGDLVLEKKYDSAISIPEEITKVVEDNAIGVDKPSATQSAEKTDTTTKKNDKNQSNSSKDNTTTTKKPANTTTTQAYSGGVYLGTGDMDEGWY